MWKKAGIWSAKAGICLVVVAGIAVLFYLWGAVFFPKWIPSVLKRGQWGDSFGVVTAFVTALAFIGLIWTIRQNSKQIAIQQKELKIQIEEQRLMREEVAGQTKLFAAQSRTLQLQSFENSFFQLLGLYNNIVNSIELVVVERKLVGRKCFHEFFNGLRGGLGGGSGKEKQEVLKYIDETYEKLFSVFPIIGQYFRNLCNIFKFVDESDLIEERKKKRYTDLIRAQLSSDELKVLFCACLSTREADFKPLVEKYAVLEDMDFAHPFEERHRTLFEESAYKSPLGDGA